MGSIRHEKKSPMHYQDKPRRIYAKAFPDINASMLSQTSRESDRSPGISRQNGCAFSFACTLPPPALVLRHHPVEVSVQCSRR
jgi:hypothetical protein